MIRDFMVQHLAQLAPVDHLAATWAAIEVLCRICDGLVGSSGYALGKLNVVAGQ